MTGRCVPRFGEVEDKYKQKTIDTKNKGGRLLQNRRPLLYLTRLQMKYVKRAEIYYANLSPAVGSEQDGMRPVLILQNDVGNIYSPTTIIAPITSKKTDNNQPTHVKTEFERLEKDSIILLEQITTIDKTRLKAYVGQLDEFTMKEVNRAIRISLAIQYGGKRKWKRKQKSQCI